MWCVCNAYEQESKQRTSQFVSEFQVVKISTRLFVVRTSIIHLSEKMSEEMCICDRPKRFVLCANCGTFVKGRIRYICPKHPNVVFSHDFQNCPKCHRFDLFNEFDLMNKKVTKWGYVSP